MMISHDDDDGYISYNLRNAMLCYYLLFRSIEYPFCFLGASRIKEGGRTSIIGY